MSSGAQLPPRKLAGNSLIRQRVAFNKFKNQEVCLAVLLKPVNSGNVRMVQLGKQLGFPFKSSKPVSVFRKLFRKRLDGDFTPEFGVLGTPHLTHSTLSQER